MRNRLSAFASLLLLALTACTPDVQPGGDLVVLLHGLGRTSRSMAFLEQRLVREGYQVANLAYPSRDEDCAALATHLDLELRKIDREPGRKIHFVTHSLGGILVRHYLADHEIPDLGRVVMLSPPNRGSEIVDRWRDNPVFKEAVGVSGLELGTEAGSVPGELGAVEFELGVIAGNRSLNPYLSSLIPGEDDGKVAVARAGIEGMADFLVVPHSHTYIMQRSRVIDQVVFFLAEGRFDRGLETNR